MTLNNFFHLIQILNLNSKNISKRLNALTGLMIYNKGQTFTNSSSFCMFLAIIWTQWVKMIQFMKNAIQTLKLNRNILVLYKQFYTTMRILCSKINMAKNPSNISLSLFTLKSTNKTHHTSTLIFKLLTWKMRLILFRLEVLMILFLLIQNNNKTQIFKSWIVPGHISQTSINSLVWILHQMLTYLKYGVKQTVSLTGSEIGVVYSIALISQLIH